MSEFDERVNHIDIIIASDVANPLCGPNGASHVFGPQKGADPEMVEQLDKNLAHYAAIIKRDLSKDILNTPGSGGAGGLGAGLLAFTHSTMRAGIDIVIEANHLDEKIAEADYVFTGEGGMDFQTKFGKTPYGVAKVAKKYDKPVFALVGSIGKGVETLYDEGITAIFGILPTAESLADALKSGPANIERTAENIARTLYSQLYQRHHSTGFHR
jgi:glycerate kinase